ncbi:beta-1,3-galactosyltransferase 5-like [Amphiura filiformis]|uniref:beta-1,3-galactosyltransferase 5-like n=1 Tax=Amphiura filiformis TaxID=82378 RepID=UPI003B228D4F
MVSASEVPYAFTFIIIFGSCMWIWMYVWSSDIHDRYNGNRLSLSYDFHFDHNGKDKETFMKVFEETGQYNRRGILDSTLLKLFNTSSIRNAPSDGISKYHHQFVKNKLFYNETVVNRHKYNYIYSNPDFCAKNTNESVFLVVMVPTRPGEIARREAIRNTWGNITHVSGRPVVVVFLLAKTTDVNLEYFIAKENKAHRDICMKDFMDTYNNLTHKVMMGLEWVDTFCSNAKFVLKIDSDMIPNLENLVNHLITKSKTTLFEGHLMQSVMPVRSHSGEEGKWFVSWDEYPHPTYPPYQIGAAYLISGDLAHQAVSISPHVPYFHIEDVYIGMLMKTLGVTATEDHRYTQEILSLHSSSLTYMSHCLFTKAFTVAGFESLDYMTEFWTLWRQFDQSQCSIHNAKD